MVEKQKDPPAGMQVVRTLAGHSQPITRIAWSPDGRLVASPSVDFTVRLWNAKTGALLHTFEHSDQATSASFAPDGRLLATLGFDNAVNIWDVTSGERVGQLPAGYGYDLEWSPDGRRIAAPLHMTTATVHEVDTGKLVLEINLADSLNSVSWSKANGLLALGINDGEVRVFNEDLELIHTWPKTGFGGIHCLAFSPDGQMLATAGFDGAITLWEVASFKQLAVMEGHTGYVLSLAFSPDGRLIASKSDDNSVRLWRVTDFATAAVIDEQAAGGPRPFRGLAFSPKGSQLATLGGVDTSIRLWEIDTAVLLGVSSLPTISYASAKVVLVGESNVGKSYLAHRITTGSPPKPGEIHSTHGMKFWFIEPEKLRGDKKSAGKLRSSRSRRGARDPGRDNSLLREVVLWDLGGQDEYRLIHQMFLHDTTVALVLLDPTRGSAALREVETWNKSLEKALRGRSVVKLLVGAKQDTASNVVDRKGLDRLVTQCGFTGYYETSALTGRGVEQLCRAAADAIDWAGTGATTRPELFQRIRDEVTRRRKAGDVVLHVADLHRALGEGQSHDEEAAAIKAVTEHLAAQGVIARSRVSSGEDVLVLQVQEIERYAGSLIVAARNNVRGVPALELAAIGQPGFPLPGIGDAERLPRVHERTVIESTVQLLLEHGICFEHEGLLVFPTLFAPSAESSDAHLSHTVSLYYDFAGAIDNIYASLVAWLVVARDFGQVRLWADRAEFSQPRGGLCGLRKVSRPGGFAHVDVYFESDTPEPQRKEFVSFVEDHLTRNGVDIREHVSIACSCGHSFAEETLRQRIARGETDVRCPVCERQHSLTEGAAEARARDADLTRRTWALRTQIEELRGKITKQVALALGKAQDSTPQVTKPIRLLHLSDLHFTGTAPVQARLQWLIDDLKQDASLGIHELDYLVVSGDFTDRGNRDGFERAYAFVSGLAQEFALSAERCIFVPGNHDICDLREAYDWAQQAADLKDGDWVRQGDIVLIRNAEQYPLRLKPFSDSFYHKFLQRPYPLDPVAQGISIPFWDAGLQFLTLNSCWQIDQFHRKRSGLHVEAVAAVIRQAQHQEVEAHQAGLLAPGQPVLRIAVWHHAIEGPEQMRSDELVGNLQKNGVRLALHGDVHEQRRDLVGYWRSPKLHVVGSGSFGARAEDRPESVPRLYNLLEIRRDLRSVRVHTRSQPKRDGPWQGWNEWPQPEGGPGAVPYYDVEL